MPKTHSVAGCAHRISAGAHTARQLWQSIGRRFVLSSVAARGPTRDLNISPPRDRLTLLQAARLVEKKGVDVAIRAFAEGRARLAELIIVGEGPERRRLEILAGELGVADHVRFMGALPYDKYQRILACAHIGIQPSRVAADGDTEGGAPTALIEMQAAGLPIVGTRHADIPFVVAHSDNLVDEEDVGGLAAVFTRLADTPASVWAQRAAEARAFVECHHDAPHVAHQIAAVYREALA